MGIRAPFGSFLKQEDVGTGVTLTIESVGIEQLEGDKGVEQKVVVTWTDANWKKWVVNKTNWEILCSIYGPDTDNWHGKPIEVYNDASIMFGGKRVGGIRCRKPSGVAAPAAPAAAKPDTGLLTFPMAVELAAKHGMTKEQVVELAKSKGNKGWDAARDTAWFRAHLLTIGPAEPGAVEEEIPF